MTAPRKRLVSVIVFVAVAAGAALYLSRRPSAPAPDDMPEGPIVVTTPQAPVPDPGDTVVATVGERDVTLLEVANLLGANVLSLGTHQRFTRRQILRGVERLAIVLEAKENDLHATEHFRAQMERDLRARLRAADSQLAIQLGQNDSKFAVPTVTVTLAEVETYIKSNPMDFEGMTDLETTRAARRIVTRKKQHRTEAQWKALTLARLKTTVRVNRQKVGYVLMDCAIRERWASDTNYRGSLEDSLAELKQMIGYSDEPPEILINGRSIPPILLGSANDLEPRAFAEIVWNNILANEARERRLRSNTRDSSLNEEMFVESLILERLQLACSEIDANEFEPTDDEIDQFISERNRNPDREINVHLRRLARDVLRQSRADEARQRYAATLMEKHSIEITIR